jgi:GxxExxY protein
VEERQSAKAQKILGREEPKPEVNDAARRIIKAAIEVHRTIGPGFPEIVYERALCIELRLRNIPFEPQPKVRVTYKGYTVGEARLDVLADGILLTASSSS